LGDSLDSQLPAVKALQNGNAVGAAEAAVVVAGTGVGVRAGACGAPACYERTGQ
jgi:hypothetical protein